MTTELKQELSRLTQGDQSLIYENTAEQLAAAVPFIIEGLARKERCIYILDESLKEHVIQSLKTAGVEVDLERQKGALQFLTNNDTFLRAGEFVPKAMIDFIRQAETEALKTGFSGLRILGEPTWAFISEQGYKRVIECEALLNDLSKNSKSVILCLYNRSRFFAPCIHDVIRTHRSFSATKFVKTHIVNRLK